MSLPTFALASLACGFSKNIEMLVLFRCLQGVAAAAINSSGMGSIRQNIRDEMQEYAFRIWGAVMGSSFAIGPILGGLIVQSGG
ncbi:MFS transporter [Corynebacterium mastitidis]|uniref:MFS transporter n=1 Tax=Corynebacterium mastitidis TaxID=161890 RepID=UPI003CC7DFDE